MPSLVPGLEYDIFISYRHNDNQSSSEAGRDGWITEFVQNLEKELRTVVKEPLSIYYDQNSHDGLLETHDVGKSLEGKLKCLIFIPIISQTYCDPKSFAWQHEFCQFNKLAVADRLGRDLKLANGNVASRILPVKIHDLEDEDKTLIENEIGGVLRPIEFIFKAPGVNRPLRADEEHPNDNRNKTYYRDQINKVANAVKGLIQATKSSATMVKGMNDSEDRPRSRKKVIMWSALFISALLLAGYFIIPGRVPTKAKPETMNVSIAVLPFENLSQDPGQEYFSDGITEQIITNLAHINSLRVIARTSVMKFKKTNKTVAEIGRELNVTHILEGSIRKSADRVRVTAQLISVSDEAHLWAQDYDRKLEDIFTIQDDVSVGIASQLERKLLPRENATFKGERPANVEAYEHYLKGYVDHQDIYYVKRLKEDFLRCESEFKEAIRLDPKYGVAYAGLADLYDSYRNFNAQTPDERYVFEKLRDSCSMIAMRLSPRNPYVLSVKAYEFSGKKDRQPADIDSTFKYRRMAYAIAPNDAGICEALAVDYISQGLYNQALQLRQRAISLDPTFGSYYGGLGQIYMILGDFGKAEDAFKRSILLEPDDINTYNFLILLELLKRNLPAAEGYARKLAEINPGGMYPFMSAALEATRAAGDKDKVLSYLKKLPQPATLMVLGMKEEALKLLEDNPNQQYLHLLSPIFDPLRKEPRFTAVLDKAKALYDERLKKYTGN
jgi:TolB-like protein/Tfp pilus assembly protein PilF